MAKLGNSLYLMRTLIDEKLYQTIQQLLINFFTTINYKTSNKKKT
jgi:hypothetical protein